MTWKQLRVELRNEFGRDGFKFFNDKNKYTRRIKIYGDNKHVVREYLNTKYPNLTMWETTQSYNHYNGICFNLNH
jgi:hypothetical protein